MNIVIDSNVLFSALIKDSTTRKVILESGDKFLFPSYVFDELRKHKHELLKKSGMLTQDFQKLLELLLRKVLVVPCETLYPYRKQALELVKEIDIGDAIFVACTLAYPNSFSLVG